MGGSKQTQTTQQQTTASTSGTATKDPWSFAQPALQDILSKAQSYGGNTSLFAPSVSSQTQAGLAGLENIAQNPTAQQGYLPSVIQGAQQGYGTGNEALTQTASGGMLNQNPYLDALLSDSRAKAMEDVAGRFSAAGRYGSNAAFGTAMGDAMSRADTAIRAQNYDSERARQLNAAQLLQSGGMQGANLAGQLDNSNVAQQQLLLNAGQTRDALDTATKQAPLTATQWMSGQVAPIASLGGTTSTTGTQSGTVDGTQTTATPANVPGMILGGLTTAAGVMSGNPMMAINGLGGLTGGMSGGSGSSSAGAGAPTSGGLGGLGGLFGGQQVFSQPGTAMNGGWSTTATTPGLFG